MPNADGVTVNVRTLPLTAQLFPLPLKLKETRATRFTFFVVGSQQPEARHRIPKATMSPGVDAGLPEAIEYAMGDLGSGIDNETLLGIKIRRRDAGFQFVLQRGVLEVEASRQVDDSRFQCLEFFGLRGSFVEARTSLIFFSKFGICVMVRSCSLSPCFLL